MSAPVTSRSRNREIPRRTNTRWIVEGARVYPNSASSATSITGPSFMFRRRYSSRSSICRSVWFGQVTGRDDRSCSPFSPSSSHRACHLARVCRATPASAATWHTRAAGVDALAQPAASFRGQRGVTVDHEGLLGAGVFAWSLHTSPGGPPLTLQPQVVVGEAFVLVGACSGLARSSPVRPECDVLCDSGQGPENPVE